MEPVGTARLTPSTARVSPKSLTRSVASTASLGQSVRAEPVEALLFLEKHAAFDKLGADGVGAPAWLPTQSLEEAIKSEAARLGFAACGFARANAADDAGLELERWLEAGHHGTMGWMETRAHHRVSPLALWPEAKSAIALGMSYAPATDPLMLAAHPEIGRISTYARGGDYHKTVKKALKALARFIVDAAPSELKVFVDTAPVMEKPLAQAAGIGWQGKHTNLVSREHGSWLFLGVILTSLELEPDAPADHGPALRVMHALPDRLPDPSVHRAASDRCAALHFLPDDRA